MLFFFPLFQSAKCHLKKKESLGNKEAKKTVKKTK